MRWFWIDRFIDFQHGVSATSIKNVSLAEEHLHDHFPGFPVMPGSLMIEGMAQTGGILLGQTHGFKHLVILAKVPRMTFHSWAMPGDQLTYTATLAEVREEGGMVNVTAKCGDRLVADGEIWFAHVDPAVSGAGGAATNQKNVVELALQSIMDVGKIGNGGTKVGI